MPGRQQHGRRGEQEPLLHRSHSEEGQDEPEVTSLDILPKLTSSNNNQNVDFSKEDEENPKNWPRSRKLTNVFIIALMTILSPLASSMFTPGMDQIAEDLGVTKQTIVGAATGFVVMLGFGPLILAPLSETFGRRNLYLICFSIFSLLQIPTALSPNAATLIAIRTISGFFGSMFSTFYCISGVY